ncbi:hypothetical protein AB0B63_07185 [Micromonospora sp. NPDC049081]|uniref:hypothetical protein n=1 Tax=Micromonospora sp. NPDC049081 TaxID=3155150 RepID=UPI003410C868
MLIPTEPGKWLSQDARYEVTHRPGADDDYKIVAVANPLRWSVAATLDEADRRINGHRRSGGRNWNPTS